MSTLYDTPAASVGAEAYTKALYYHDWSFEYSDDDRVYRRGKAEREWLREAAKRVDPTSEIWNSIAPSNYKRAS